MTFNFDYYFEGQNEVDIYIESGESYVFEGVSAETPVDLNNVANISFVVMNGNETSITGVDIELIYTTTTGNSKQTAIINLYDENDTVNPIQSQTVTFKGKQTNTAVTLNFTQLNIPTGTKLTVKFNQGNIANGAVDISSVKLTPVF